MSGIASPGRPQPRRTTHAGQIAMPIAHDRRVHEVAEHVACHQRRQCRVEVVHIGQSAAQHDHVRVEQVDHMRQPARQPIGMAFERNLRPRLTSGGAGWGSPDASCAPLAVAVARPATGRRPRSRGNRGDRTSIAGPASSSRGQGSGLWPHSPATWLRPRARRSTTTPPPQPVPRMTPNTTRVRRRRRRSLPRARSSWRRSPPALHGRAAR